MQTTLATAFDKHDAIARAQTIQATFGHLNPDGSHNGTVIFGVSEYGHAFVLQTNFPSAELSDGGSPALYDAHNDMLNVHGDKKPGIYQLTGKLKANGYECKITGRVHCIKKY